MDEGKCNTGNILADNTKCNAGNTLVTTPVKKVVGKPWQKGVSGNPNGRRPVPPEIRQALTSLVPEAVARLSDIVRHSKDDKLVMEAVKVVLDRVYGRPSQSLDIESNNNHTVEVILAEQVKQWAI